MATRVDAISLMDAAKPEPTLVRASLGNLRPEPSRLQWRLPLHDDDTSRRYASADRHTAAGRRSRQAARWTNAARRRGPPMAQAATADEDGHDAPPIQR